MMTATTEMPILSDTLHIVLQAVAALSVFANVIGWHQNRAILRRLDLTFGTRALAGAINRADELAALLHSYALSRHELTADDLPWLRCQFGAVLRSARTCVRAAERDWLRVAGMFDGPEADQHVELRDAPTLMLAVDAVAAASEAITFTLDGTFDPHAARLWLAEVVAATAVEIMEAIHAH